jgi:hypothetical protein
MHTWLLAKLGYSEAAHLLFGCLGMVVHPAKEGAGGVFQCLRLCVIFFLSNSF